MSYDEVRIHALDDGPTYTRRYNGATYDDYDAPAVAYPGAATALWADTSDIMYFGFSASTRSHFGFHMAATAGVTGLSWEYSTGASSWTAFTPIANNVDSFAASGIVAWDRPPAATAWAAHTHSGALPSAYWIRASITGHTGTGTFYNLLPLLTLGRPLKLYPSFEREGYSVAIDSLIKPLDLAYAGPNRLRISCGLHTTMDANNQGMPNLNLLHYWKHNRKRLKVVDLAQDDPPDLATDAFYLDYIAYLEEISSAVASPFKMDRLDYELTFKVQAVTTLL